MTHIIFLIAALLGQAFMNGLLCVPTYIDAKLPKKLQYFLKFSQNCEKAERMRPGFYPNIVFKH